MTHLKKLYYKMDRGTEIETSDTWGWFMIVDKNGIEVMDHPYSWVHEKISEVSLNKKFKRSIAICKQRNILNYYESDKGNIGPDDLFNSYRESFESRIHAQNTRTLQHHHDLESEWSNPDYGSGQYGFRDLG